MNNLLQEEASVFRFPAPVDEDIRSSTPSLIFLYGLLLGQMRKCLYAMGTHLNAATERPPSFQPQQRIRLDALCLQHIRTKVWNGALLCLRIETVDLLAKLKLRVEIV